MTTVLEDPNVRLPKQVRQADRASDRAVQSLSTPPAQPTPVVPAPIATPNQPIDTSATPPPGSQPDATVPQQKPIDWKQRHDVLQGKYNAELPRYAAEVRSLKERIAQLEAENARLKTGETKLPGQMTPERRKELGDDYVKTHQEIVADAVTPVTKDLERRIESLQAEVQQTKRNALFDALTDLCPPWREINDSDAWKIWLAEMDDATGYQRQDMLNKHLSESNARRISAMFKQWADAYPDEFAAVAKGKPISSVKLESQIVPDRMIAEPPRATTPARVTREFIRQFHKDQALGKYDRNPARAKEIETLIQEAVSSGNVV